MSERAGPIEFWFSVGSTYTCLAVMRLPAVERETGVPFDWRPFSVRAIMQEMDNVPFATKPVKVRHMWRDIERHAEARGLSARLPAPYPLKGFDLADRVATLGREEGWCRDHARATYRRWIGEGQPAGEEPNLSGSLAEIGQDPERVLERARSDEVGALYEAATREARERGVFGAPSFVVGGELFWGDDRLEDALDWLRRAD